MTPQELTQASFIGCALLEPVRCRDSIMRLSPAMFSEGPFRDIFSVIQRLAYDGRGVDPVTVNQEMGGSAQNLILDCARTAPAVHHAPEYEALILEDYRRQRITSVALAVASDQTSTADHLCERMAAELKIQNTLLGQQRDATAKEWDDILDEALAAISKPDNSLKTDWICVDRYGMFERGNVVVVAGRPGGGKTDFSVSIAARLSKRYRVYYLTLEETRVRLMYRLLSKATHIDHARIRDKRLSPAERQSLNNTVSALKRSRNMVIDEGSGMTVGGIRAKILKYKPDVVFIDHCGLIVGEDARMSRLDVIANATNQLKAMAKEMGIVVVELVQLKRTTDRTGGVRAATLSDLKGSGTYEEDANSVLFVESDRDPSETPLQGEDAYREVPIRVEKNRDGEVGRLRMYWQPQYHDWYPVQIQTQEEMAAADPFTAEQKRMG